MKNLVKKAMMLISWVKKRGKGEYSKEINFRTIRNFLEAELTYWREHNKGETYLTEIAEWRLDQIGKKSPKCLQEGKCIHCGCSIPSKVYEKDSCEYGCYPERPTEQEWIEFKKTL